MSDMLTPRRNVGHYFTTVLIAVLSDREMSKLEIGFGVDHHD